MPAPVEIQIQRVNELNAKLVHLQSKLDSKRNQEEDIKRMYEEKICVYVKRELQLKISNELKRQQIVELQKKLEHSCHCNSRFLLVPTLNGQKSHDHTNHTSTPSSVKSSSKSPKSLQVGNHAHNNKNTNDDSSDSGSSRVHQSQSPFMSFADRFLHFSHVSPGSHQEGDKNHHISDSIANHVFNKLKTDIKNQQTNYVRMLDFVRNSTEATKIDNLMCSTHPNEESSHHCCLRNHGNISELIETLGEYASVASPLPSPLPFSPSPSISSSSVSTCNLQSKSPSTHNGMPVTPTSVQLRDQSCTSSSLNSGTPGAERSLVCSPRCQLLLSSPTSSSASSSITTSTSCRRNSACFKSSSTFLSKSGTEEQTSPRKECSTVVISLPVVPVPATALSGLIPATVERTQKNLLIENGKIIDLENLDAFSNRKVSKIEETKQFIELKFPRDAYLNSVVTFELNTCHPDTKICCTMTYYATKNAVDCELKTWIKSKDEFDTEKHKNGSSSSSSGGRYANYFVQLHFLDAKNSPLGICKWFQINSTSGSATSGVGLRNFGKEFLTRSEWVSASWLITKYNSSTDTYYDERALTMNAKVLCMTCVDADEQTDPNNNENLLSESNTSGPTSVYIGRAGSTSRMEKLARLEMLRGQLNALVKFKCGPKLDEIMIYETILSYYSPILKSLFDSESELNNHKPKEILLPFVSIKSMRAFYDFIHGSDPGFWHDDVLLNLELLRFGQKYMTVEVVEQCTENLYRTANPLFTMQTSLMMMEAGQYYNIPVLEDKAFKWIASIKPDQGGSVN